PIRASVLPVIVESAEDLPVVVVGEGFELAAVLVVPLAQIEPDELLIGVVRREAAAGSPFALPGHGSLRAIGVVPERISEILAIAHYGLAQRAAGLVEGRRRGLGAVDRFLNQVVGEERVGRRHVV